jgi:hypothetical protein
MQGDCIQGAEEIILGLEKRYLPCSECEEVHFKKFSPLFKQTNLPDITSTWKHCNCGKRHLDVVMAHVMKILIEDKLLEPESNLRNLGTPLITPTYPLNSYPYLPRDSVVLLLPIVNKHSAEKVVTEVPEVKGVIKGNMKNTVGIRDAKSDPVTYELMAGCDMRCDVFNTSKGPVCIQKPQSKIHIEISKPVSPKITSLNKFFDQNEHPTVLDSTCGPGTLGIVALKLGAKKVVFNDLWLPAAQTTLLNLEVNGFPIQLKKENDRGLLGCGDNFEVYCLDIKDLNKVLNQKFDLCLVDTFPGVDFNVFVNSVRDMCGKVLILD